MISSVLFVDLESFDTFDQYISSLGKSTKKNYRYCVKNNKDLEFLRTAYDRDLVERFISLWNGQRVRNKRAKISYTEPHVEWLYSKGSLDIFMAREKDTGKVLSAQWFERHDNYVCGHPVLWDKSQDTKRYMGKYMWFNAIKYYLENTNIKFFDFGSAFRGYWPQLIKDREKHKYKLGYKWHYIPEAVKNAPESQPDIACEHTCSGACYERMGDHVHYRKIVLKV